jgi:hypothetical protein
MIEVVFNAFEAQAFIDALVGEATNELSAKAAFFAFKSVGVAILGMTANFRRPTVASKSIALKIRKRKPASAMKRASRRRN